MKWLFPVVALVLMALAIWTLTGAPSSDAPTRTVAFDNMYGTVERLPVHVRVDDGPEQSLTSTCDRATCTFTLPLTSAQHVLTLSVEQDGKRSAPTRVAVDAGR